MGRIQFTDRNTDRIQRKQRPRRAALFLTAVLCAMLCAVQVLAAGKGNSRSTDTGASKDGSGLVIRYLDVGQGDAALITCDGESMLVDGGTASQSSKIYSVLKKQGITELRYIVATHPDADHIGGIPGALNYAACDVLLSPVTTSDKTTFQKLAQKCREQKVKIEVPDEGEELELGDAVITILGPTDELPDDTNNNSIFFRLDYGTVSFLFTGDAEQLEQQLILHNEYDALQADVLKMPHHGSSNAASEAFLDAVNPTYAVISCEKGNSYGHPHEETMELLQDHETMVYRTDLQGDIVCTSDGTTIAFETAKETKEDLYVPGSALSKADAGASQKEEAGSSAKSAGSTSKTDSSSTAEEQDYIVNKNTGKFHYPDCSSVKRMKESNKRAVRASREQMLADGYSPCGNCNP